MRYRFLLLIILLWLARLGAAQSITDVEAQYAKGSVTVTFRLDSPTPKDLILSYSGDDGTTYTLCRSVSGDLKNQTSGNKQIVWNCLDDNVVFGIFVFKVAIDPFPYQMVFVPGGTFTMGCTPEQGSVCCGDEKPAHQVTVSDFYIGTYPVTQAEWKAVMGSYSGKLYNTGCDNCPMDNVSWNDTQDFIRKVNSLTGRQYRLPTEAEWEYAARGGNRSNGYEYSGSNSIDEVAWYERNYKKRKHGRQGTTHPVGTKKANELGIYDMSGNVREWCNDWFSNYSSGAVTDPQGAASGSDRVLRGGSWGSNNRSCRVSNRSCYTGYNHFINGFRLCLVP